MWWICNKTVNIYGIYTSLKEAFKFCWSLFADELNTWPKPTRRKVKLNKSAFGTPRLPDLLCKHWFTSSLWNFCCWVADVSPCETSPAGRGEEKQLFSQATDKQCDGDWVDVTQSCQGYAMHSATVHRSNSLKGTFSPHLSLLMSLRTHKEGFRAAL